MKKITIFLSILCMSVALSAQTTFQTTIRTEGIIGVGARTINIYIKPDATVSKGFAAMEFFIRYPSSEALSFSNFQANTTDFPLSTFNVNELTPTLREAGYNSIHIGFVQNVAPTTVRSYTAGQEYKVCSILVGGSASVANLQIVHNSSFVPYYLSLADELSVDVAPALEGSYFYPTTSSAAPDLKFYSFDVPLPLALLDFTAQANKQTAHLKWQTANERTAAYFDIEKSVDNKNWTKVGSQKAKNTEGGYLFSDAKAFEKNSTVFYRLKMMEQDGNFSYSAVRQVQTQKTNGLMVYPNPAKSILMVEGIEAEDIGQVVDILGKVRTIFKGQQQLDLTGYTDGIYFIKMDNGSVSQFVVNH
jgi:Secretion system C-terminal sorting domain